MLEQNSPDAKREHSNFVDAAEALFRVRIDLPELLKKLRLHASDVAVAQKEEVHEAKTPRLRRNSECGSQAVHELCAAE